MSEGTAEVSPAVFRALAAAQNGIAAQALLERTLGKALLAKMTGQQADLLETYRGLGGNDPGVMAMLAEGMNDVFQTLDVGPGIEEGRRIAVSEAVRRATGRGGGSAGKQSVQLQGNQLTQVEGQALNTLAALGGPEFAAKYGVAESKG